MRRDLGIVAALGAAVLFGISAPLAKLLVAAQSPLLLSGLLYVGSGLGLALVLGLRSLAMGSGAIRWPLGSDRWWLAGAIVSGGIVGPYLLMVGLRLTDSATGALTLNLEGVFTAMVAWFAFGENVDRRIALGMALITLGGVALSVGPALGGGGYLGPLAIAGACLAWGLDNNLTRRVSANDALVIACLKGLLAGATSLALSLATGAELPAARWVALAGVLGFVCFGLCLTLFVIALRHLGAARTGAYFALAPFIGALLALLLGAPFTATLAAAGLLMAAGVWLHLTERHVHGHTHERLVHDHPHRHDAHHRHTHESGWDGSEPHSHPHEHEPMTHTHAHYPDIHHRHEH